MKLSLRLLCLVAAVALAVLLGGCKKAGADGKAFQNAKPEAKAAWDAAMAARKTNGYAMAIVQLKALRDQSGLSAEQTSTVDAALKQINDDMYDAANRDDPAGKQALEDLKKMMGR